MMRVDLPSPTPNSMMLPGIWNESCTAISRTADLGRNAVRGFRYVHALETPVPFGRRVSSAMSALRARSADAQAACQAEHHAPAQAVRISVDEVLRIPALADESTQGLPFLERMARRDVH